MLLSYGIILLSYGIMLLSYGIILLSYVIILLSYVIILLSYGTILLSYGTILLSSYSIHNAWTNRANAHTEQSCVCLYVYMYADSMDASRKYCSSFKTIMKMPCSSDLRATLGPIHHALMMSSKS